MDDLTNDALVLLLFIGLIWGARYLAKETAKILGQWWWWW